MRITEKQEQIIYELVESQGLDNLLLKNDLLDHLYCIVEVELQKDISFDRALENALLQLAPNGLKEIEYETIYLFNLKRIIFMKKIMFTLGFLGAFSLSGGVTLKLLRLPMGSEFFTIGFLMILLLFVPLYAIDRYKVSIARNLSQRLKIILGVSAAVITGLSGLFKVLHLQGAELLLMLGAFIFAVGFLPFLFFTMYKKSVSQ